MVLDDNAYLYREGNHRGININGPFYNLTVGTSEADLVHFQKTSGQETNGRRIVEGTGGLFVDRPGRDFRLVVPLSTWEAG